MIQENKERNFTFGLRGEVHHAAAGDPDPEEQGSKHAVRARMLSKVPR
jgi:hypothetical protein